MTTVRNRRKTTAIATAVLLAGAFLTGGAVALDQHVDGFDVPVFVVAEDSGEDDDGSCVHIQEGKPPGVLITPSDCLPPLP